jgi:heat shock protein HslJ
MCAMNWKSLFNHQLIWYTATLMIGFVGAVATPVVAQHIAEKPLSLHAQSANAIAGSWRLVSISESSAPTPMVPPQTPELTADFAGGRITGSGGCNRFMGGYTTKANQLSIDPLASTRKACEQALMTQEFKYLKALQGAQRYEVDNQGLQIYYKTDQESGVLRFTSQAVRGLW